MGLVEKNVFLNLIKLILKFDDVWITCFRSLDFIVVPILEPEFPWVKKLQVRETKFNF